MSLRPEQELEIAKFKLQAQSLSQDDLISLTADLMRLNFSYRNCIANMVKEHLPSIPPNFN